MKRITLPDYQFRLGVRAYDGIIHAEQGVPMFYCEDEGLVARLTFPVTADQYEEPATAYIRNGEDEVLSGLDTDDILEDDLRDDMLDITEQYAYLSDYLNEQRVQYLPKGLKWISGAILTGIAAIAAIYFKKYIIAAVAFGLTVLQIFLAWSTLRVIVDTRIYDKRGRWFDTATGQSNLNGGYTVSIAGEE